jgi:hypothetical protein
VDKKTTQISLKDQQSNKDETSTIEGANTSYSKPKNLSRPSSRSDIFAYFPKSPIQDLPIGGLLIILHLALDTFEIPKNSSWGAGQGSAAVVSPTVVVLYPNSSISTTTNAELSPGISVNNRRSNPGLTEGQSRSSGNIATSLLYNLGCLCL